MSTLGLDGGAAVGLPVDPDGLAGPGSVAVAPRRRFQDRFRGRHLWLVAGLAVTIAADQVASGEGIGIAVLILAQLLPHVPAWLPRSVRRQPAIVTTFNVLHHPLVPLALIGAAAIGLLSPLWLVSAMAWLGHIVIDWALGDGIRSTDGSKRSPRLPAAVLGALGRPAPTSVHR